jgi:hypothetical protein
VNDYKVFVLAAAAIAPLVAFTVPAPGHADVSTAAPYVTEMPQGYREWKWVRRLMKPASSIVWARS